MKKYLFFIGILGLLVSGCHKNEVENDDSVYDVENNGPGEWVNLGLPSRVLWYSVNIGATTPEEYGNYYAWGETEEKTTYNWSTYRYATTYDGGGLESLTKYFDYVWPNLTPGDNKFRLEAIDDVATVVLGGGARMPTENEWFELLDNTTAEWTIVNNVSGVKFTASNGNSIFLPAAQAKGSNRGGDDAYGIYWSSERPNDDHSAESAACMFLEEDFPAAPGTLRRYVGMSVRAVHSRN